MRFSEIINEGRDADLYHNLDYRKIAPVLSNNSLPALWQHDIPGLGKIKGNSFTRNSLYGTEYQHGGYSVQLVFDQAKLAQRHRIIPVNAEMVHTLNRTNYSRRRSGLPDFTVKDMGKYDMDRTKRQAAARMDEEFVVGDIKNLNNYLKEIRVFRIPDAAAPYYLYQYSTQYKIPLVMSEQVKKNYTSMLNRLKRGIKAGKDTAPEVVPHAVADREKFFSRYQDK
jgi:hypothetical protein